MSAQKVCAGDRAHSLGGGSLRRVRDRELDGIFDGGGITGYREGMSLLRASWFAVALVVVAGCRDGGSTADTGPAGSGGDGATGGGSGGAGGAAGGGGGMGAGEPYVETSTPTSPAEVVQAGGTDLLLRGQVLTPTGLLDPGEVLVVGDTITCVADDCTTAVGADTATWINTNGVISPGLIDGHNHMSYNFLPEWVPPPDTLFDNRYVWADDPGYEEHILPYSANRSSNTHFCPGSKWAELRSMAHGTTTMQGQPSASGSCINWGVRNANQYHGLGYDHMRANIGTVRDLTDADADGLIASFDQSVNPATRYVVHMAEGIAGETDEEFDSFAGRDPRMNRHNGVSLLHNGTSVLIHSIPLSDEQLEEAAQADAKIVWSPSSNFVLYGDGMTAPIGRILEMGITAGLGPDWTLSGQDEMLSEMRFAINYASLSAIEEVTTQRLWEMATMDGAVVVGLETFIGRIEVGYRADIAVFGRSGPDPYAAVLESRIADVRLVLIDGVGFFGDDNIATETSRNAFCEAFDGCGTAKYICVQDSPTADTRRDETLDDIRTQLFNILEGIGYPAEEQYGRGDELLELADCSL